MEKGGIFVVRKLEMKFKKPAILDNEIMIETKLLRLGHVSFDFLQKIYFKDSLLVEATVGCGCLEANTFNPLPLPKKLYAGMKTLL
jgi:acyl-CoA thioester hydrolase